MKDIKTKESIKDIKVLDKAAGLAKVTKNATVHTKQQVQNLSDDARITPDEYAEDKVKYMAETVAEGTGKAAKQTVNNIYDGGNRLYREIRRTRKEAESARSAAKTLHKSIKTGRQSIKTAQHTTKTTVKTAQQTAKAAKKTAEASAKAARMAAQATKQAAQATYKATVFTAKAVAAAVKAAIAGIKALVAAIAAGGFVSVVIIIIICIIALIAGSCFGIFFIGEDTGSGITLQNVISEINNEYEAKITEIKNSNTYDVLEMSGNVVWPEVLSVYAVKIAGDPNNPQEVVSMDENKKHILTDIFWEMNEITHSVTCKTENVVTEIDSVNGNIVETAESDGRAYLYINVIHKSVDEMAEQCGFSESQKEQLSELLSEYNKKMWSGVLYDISQ